MVNSFLRFLKLIRAHQYVKNAIIFLPLVFQLELFYFSYKLFIYGFLSFCFVASAGYLINDIRDINYDKLHPLKKNRPLANNEISIFNINIIIFLFLVLSFYTATFVSNIFFYYILFYFLYSILYTFFLKKISIIDIFFLSIFYCIRIFSGAEILNQIISIWLIFFSFIFFSYLASIKRLADLNLLTKKKFKHSYYQLSDYELLKIITPCLMMASILILFSYLIISSKLIHSQIIGYLIILILIIWNVYLIKQLFRNKINEDPVLFVLKDKTTLILIFLFLILLIVNFYLRFNEN
jgi:4-hydroxybenzoate polyprenyltransferase